MTDQEFKDLYTWMLRNFTNPKPELAEEWHRKIGRTDYDVAFTAVDRISDVRKSFPTYPDFWKAYEEVKGERKAEQQGEKENACGMCDEGRIPFWEKRNGQWYHFYCLCSCLKGAELAEVYQSSARRNKQPYRPIERLYDVTKREQEGAEIEFQDTVHHPGYEAPKVKVDTELAKSFASLMDAVAKRQGAVV